MELLCALAGKVLEFTLEPIGRQLGYLISYHSNVKKLKDEFKELQNEREAVQHLVDDAQRQGEDIEVKVQDWFSRVNEITELVDKFYGEETHANTDCSFKSCPNLWLRHQISRKAKKMTLEVADIKEKGKFDKVGFSKPPELVGVPSTSSSTVNEGMESRISIMNQVMEALADPNVDMVGLCGLPGVGKTTLAKQVATMAKEQKLFDKVVWVTVAQNPDFKGIQMQIADNVGMKLEVDSVNARASHLNQRLKKEKNLLVVLDDLWERLDLDEVGIPFDDKSFKCKILLTSRNEDLLYNQMNCRKNIRVGVLSEEEALKLFKENAELSDDSDHIDLLSMAAEVVKQCGGLPLAIVAVARSLKNKRKLGEWRDALKRLKNPLRRNLTGIKEVDSLLMFSYDDLDAELQSIFLLSATLSHDPLIIDLLMYSMGLSLLQDVHSMRDAQDALDVLISKLKASSLLLDSFSNARFTMHDVFRDFSLSIASKEQRVLVVRHEEQYDWPRKTLLEGYTRMCLEIQDSIELPEELYCPTLEFFLLNSMGSDLKIPSTFFKPMNELKVMGLTDVHLSSLPSSIGLLEKLTTLCLHSCQLEDIADVGKLKNLTTLSLAFSNIKQLPCELAQLTCLKMLNLAHCSKLEVIPPKLLSKLKGLEVLYMENSFNKWEAEGSSNVNENASLAELRHLTKLSSLNIHICDASVLPNDLFLENSLERYRILIGEDWEWSSKCETSKTLKLKLDNSSYLQPGIQKLLESVEDLFLDGVNDVLSYLDGSEFPHLKHLWIQNNDQIEYVVSNSTRLVVFSNLETLNLHNLKGLKKLCQGRRMAASLPNLRVIKVRNCDELKILFSDLRVGLFSQLVEIDIEGCNAMNGIVVSTDECSFHKLCYLKMRNLSALEAFHFEEDASNNESNRNVKSLFNNKVSFPMLETLDLYQINNLIPSIWDDHLPQNSFGNLKTLTVRECGFLVKLVPLHVLICLSHLEELDVSDCESLEMVFDFDDLNNYKKTDGSWIVPLKKIKLYDLPKLMHVWSNDDPHQIFSFQSLRQVEVFSCERLKSMFPASVAKGLVHLEELDISYCGIDVIVAKAQVSESGAATFVFPKLNKLQLLHLPNLKNLYEDRHTSEWPCLQHLSIDDCDELEIFGKEDSSSSSLQEESPYVKYPLFFHEKVIPNLKKLTLDGKKLAVMFSQLGFAATFLNLKELTVYGSTFSKERFLKPPLRDDCGQLDLILPNLESLDVSYCDDLIKWGPSFISFKNLREIEVSNCNGLTSLLTSSTASSLVQLTRLKISWCDNIEEIIAKEGDEDVEKEIINFKKLRSLELARLPNLKSFCSHNYAFMFPSLDKVIIRDCSRFSMFCQGDIHAPLLKEVECGYYHEKLLETNLNKTVLLLFLQEVTDLELYPEMKNLWVEKLPNHKPFGKLERLIVDNCNFLSEYVIPAHLVKCLSNLKKLKVRNCHSIKTIFDVKGMELDEEAHTSLANLGLRKLELHHLPNLINIFVASTAKGLTQLAKLVIESCGVLDVIVAEDETLSEESPCFVFPQLTHLTLRKLPNLKSFLVQKVIPNLKKLTLDGELLAAMLWKDQLSFAATFLNLKELRVYGSDFFKERFSEPLRDDFFQLDLILPNLESLHVSHCDDFIKWGPSFISFKNLTHIDVWSCDRLTSLLTSSTATSLVQLTSLTINWCDKIEEIIAKEGDDDVEKEIINFKKLRYLELARLPNLKSFCSHNYAFMFPSLHKVIIRDCSRLTMFCPGDIHAPLLKGVEWEYGEELWETNLNKTVLLLFTEVTYLELYPEMRNLWVEKLPHHKPFSKLQRLVMDNCDFLCEYVIPGHLVKCLSNLKELRVRNCHSIKTILEVIVAEDETSSEESPCFVFPQLNHLELRKLPNLKSFHPQRFTIECPQLANLFIFQCENLKAFGSKMTSVTVSCEEDEVETQQPLFLVEKVIPRLKGLALNQKDVTMIRDGEFEAHLFDQVETLYLESFFDESVTFPYSFIERFPNLEGLGVLHSCFEEILPSQAQIVNHKGKIAPFKQLSIGYMDQLKTIWNENDDSHLQPIHQDLQWLKVESCCRLIKLTPSFASFENLTYLKVSGCHQLIYLITSSTAKSLVNLQELEITDCERMEEIVTNESENVEGGITFNELRKLKLTRLPSLKSFCSQNHIFKFPCLETLVINGCHQMKTFCPGVVETSELEEVEIDEDVKGLEGDLNKTIELSLLRKDGKNI